MRKSVSCVSSLVMIIIVCFTGCESGITEYRNIDEIIFARAIAIDKSNAGNVMVTIAYQVSKDEGQSDSAPGKKQYAEITSEGKTIFEAVRNFDSFSNKKVFLGQVDFILFGEETAKDGLLKYIDFFARYEEVNLDTGIFIAKGATAKDILGAARESDYPVSKYLEKLNEDSRNLSVSGEVKLKDIVRMLDKDYISTYLPSLRLKESVNKNAALDIEMDGYAVFKGETLAGYLSGEEARGFNWITDNVASGVILVKGTDGKDISLEIHSSKTKISPVLHDSSISVTISVDMSSNISEQTSREDIYNEKTLEYLKSQQEQVIKREIGQALALAKEKRIDVFGIGDIIYHSHPVKWQSIKNGWADIFPGLEINVEVTSEIKRTYIIKQPTGSETD